MNSHILGFLWFLFLLSFFLSGIAYLNWYMTKRLKEKHNKKAS